MKIGLKLTESEFYTLTDWVEVFFHSKMEHEVFKKEFSWGMAYELGGIGSFENSTNCSDACNIYKFCYISNETLFREMIEDGIYNYRIGVANNTNFLTGELKKPQFKVAYDDLKSILNKLDSYIEWHNEVSKNLPMVVKQPHPMDRPNRIGKVKDLLEDDGRDYYGF